MVKSKKLLWIFFSICLFILGLFLLTTWTGTFSKQEQTTDAAALEFYGEVVEGKGTLVLTAKGGDVDWKGTATESKSCGNSDLDPSDTWLGSDTLALSFSVTPATGYTLDRVNIPEENINYALYGRNWNVSISRPSTTNVVRHVYAYFEPIDYSIAYNLNDGDYGTYHPTSATFDEYVRISNPTKDGFEFAGWTAVNMDTSTAKYGSTTSTTSSWKNSSTKVKSQYFRNLRSSKGTVTLTAQWEPVTYDIKYNLNGGDYGTYHPTTAKYNSSFQVSNPTQEGYDFIGWTASNLNTSTAKYGSSAVSLTNSWTNGSTKVTSEYFINLQSKDSAVTLIANWEGVSYSVVFNGNGATSGNMSNQTFTYGTAQNLKSNSYSRAGYSFIGWGTSRNATSPTYRDGESVINLTSTRNGRVNLYALWEASDYTLTFNANGGTVSPSSITVTYGMPYGYYNGGELPIPTRTGYVFRGWSVVRNDDNYVKNKRVASDIYNVAGHSTLYAIWLNTWYSNRVKPSGAGTYANPYIIETSQNLGWLTYRVANGYDTNAYCEQRANIDTMVDGTINGILEYSWFPIGTPSSPFSGYYDGGGCSLDIWMRGSSYDSNGDFQEYTGMFGYLRNATISGLYLMTNAIEGVRSTGGVAGYASNSIITGCGLYTGNLSSNTSTRGAIIGYGNSSTIIRDCTVFEATTSYGTLGLASGSASVTNCVYVINNRKGYVGSDFSNFVLIENMKIPLPKGIAWIAEGGGEPATLPIIQAWANS